MIVEADEDQSAGPELGEDRAKGAFAVAGVVEHAVRDHDIEAFVAKWRPEEVHLHEGDVADRMSIRKALGETQRIEAQIAGEDGALPRHAKEVAQLTRAASSLENTRAMRQLLVEQRGEDAAPRLGGETVARIEFVVVRKRRFFVERLDRFG